MVLKFFVFSLFRDSYTGQDSFYDNTGSIASMPVLICNPMTQLCKQTLIDKWWKQTD